MSNPGLDFGPLRIMLGQPVKVNGVCGLDSNAVSVNLLSWIVYCGFVEQCPYILENTHEVVRR